jgi:hypothetical protein
MFIEAYLNGANYSLVKTSNKAIAILQRHSGPSNIHTMKYATVEDVISCLPHPVLPSVTGEQDYHTLHAIRKILRANARSIETHPGGGAFGHLGVIISDAAYKMISNLNAWENPEFPGRAPTAIEGGGTSAQISAEKHRWEEATT